MEIKEKLKEAELKAQEAENHFNMQVRQIQDLW